MPMSLHSYMMVSAAGYQIGATSKHLWRGGLPRYSSSDVLGRLPDVNDVSDPESQALPWAQ